MRRRSTAGLLAFVTLAPAALSAQGIGVGAHAGLNGFGVDVGLGLSSNLVLRGGISLAPEDYFLTGLLPSDISGIEYDVILPRTTLRAGLEFHVLGPLKLMGGIMYRSDDLVTRATVRQSIEIGGTTFDESGTVEARLDQNSMMPYAGVGFGKMSSGFGIYLDLGIAYSGEADIVMTAYGDLANAPGIDAALQEEADQYLEDAPTTIKKLYPILQVGVKFGLGR
ncbi:MAG TPA: hypothetical protein VLA43_17215 [Longimicrobiales bacterium]|nr:hypothetical protein [Longimicrobiales bacterium]